MAQKQTSPEVSSLAAKCLSMSAEDLVKLYSTKGPVHVAEIIRTLSASCLSQDETKG